MTTSDCADKDFCNWAGGCATCRPDTWRAIRPHIVGRRGTWHGQSYEYARESLKHLAAELRDVTSQLDAAHTDGWRLYDVADNGTIYLAKGRVRR